MSTDGQPIDPRIPFYIPENWIQPSGSGVSGSFVTFPTAQTANILFPGSISCSNLQSFAPSAPMNLFNDSTSGNIEIANNFGYTGGIVINADATTPVAGKIIIGDSARALVAPNIETNLLQGYGFSEINVNSDLFVNSGYTVYTNNVDSVSDDILNIATSNNTTKINIGTSIGHTADIDIGTNMGVATAINLGGLNGITNAMNLESGLISCASNATLSIGTFTGRTTDIDIGTGMTSGNINLGGANSITNAEKLQSQFISCETDKSLIIGRVASRTTPISIGSLGLGDGTTTGSIFIGSGNNSSTSSISLGSSTLENSYIRAKTLRLNDGANADSTIIGSTFTGNTVTVNAPTTLNKPVFLSATSIPPIPDDTYQVPSTSWVNTTINNEGFAKKTVLNLFTAKNEFSDVIRVNDIAGYTNPNININQAVCSAPGTTDGSNRVVSSQWVRDQGFVSGTTGFARYDATLPTASFDNLNEFKIGVRANLIQLYETGGITALTLPTNIKTNTIELVSGTSLTLPNIKTNEIALVSGASLTLPVSTTTTPAVPDNTTIVPTTSWVNTTITNAIAGITGFATYAGTTAFTALQTFNAGITINSAATPLTITASNRAETYNTGGSSTVRRFIGPTTTGASAASMSFARRSTTSSTSIAPFQIFSQTNGSGLIKTAQYMELIISGVITRTSGDNNNFTTKASFVITNYIGDTGIQNGSFSYDKLVSSIGENVVLTPTSSSIYELNLRVDIPQQFFVRQDYFATLITYPSMATGGLNTNFRIGVT